MYRYIENMLYNSIFKKGDSRSLNFQLIAKSEKY